MNLWFLLISKVRNHPVHHGNFQTISSLAIHIISYFLINNIQGGCESKITLMGSQNLEEGESNSVQVHPGHCSFAHLTKFQSWSQHYNSTCFDVYQVEKANMMSRLHRQQSFNYSTDFIETNFLPCGDKVKSIYRLYSYVYAVFRLSRSANRCFK